MGNHSELRNRLTKEKCKIRKDRRSKRVQPMDSLATKKRTSSEYVGMNYIAAISLLTRVEVALDSAVAHYVHIGFQISGNPFESVDLLHLKCMVYYDCRHPGCLHCKRTRESTLPSRADFCGDLRRKRDGSTQKSSESKRRDIEARRFLVAGYL
jgi:hypothetical protein